MQERSDVIRAKRGRHRLRVRWTGVFALYFVGGVAACVPGGATGGADPAAPPVITLAEGRLSADAEREAADLLASARTALDEGRPADARVAAAEVVEAFPASRVSVEALLTLSRAEAAAGDVEAATVHAERLARVLPPDDDRQTEVATVRARALAAADRRPEAVAVLLALPPELAPVGGEADELVRSVAARLDREALGRVLQEAPLGSPLGVPVMLAYAGRLRLVGDLDGARRFASAALDAGAGGEDAEVARAILEGQALPGAAPGRLAVVLPLSGSPALRGLAEGIREGVEAALTASSLGDAVTVEYLDDGGDPTVAADLVRSAAGEGVDGFIGPLQDDVLRMAASARPAGVSMVSPTAYELPEGAPAVYSLASVDPGAPLALAEWAAGVGIGQVVVLHPSRGPSAEEGRIFAESFQAQGGSVLRVLTYDPGDTFFRDQMRAVHGLRPEALVLPIPPEDVEAIASQAAFYALDTLGIQLLGTAAWGDPSVRASVSTRYTDGVVTATPRAAGQEAGLARFIEAYEERFQRTLTGTGVAAAGYDAASLLLRALESGVRGPSAVAGAVEEIDGFEGATGVLSVREGRVLRRHAVVCVQNAGLVDLPPGRRPVPVYRPYGPDPRTGIVPEGPGRPAGFRCLDTPAEVR